MSAKARLVKDTKNSMKDNGTVASALYTGWLFLLRVSEYCRVDGETQDYCRRMGYVTFYDPEKRDVAFQDAQKALTMSIVIRGSEKDRARAGYTQRLNRTGFEIDAADSVVNMLRSCSSEWLADPSRPLFELESGKTVSST